MGAFAQSDNALFDFSFQIAVRLGGDGGREVGLFINDYTPIPGVALSDLTEPGVAGYARSVIDAGTWIQGIDTHVIILTAPAAAFFSTTDGTGELCYGYFTYNSVGLAVDWAQRFDTPQLLKDGLPITFTPRYKFKDCPD